MDANLKKRIDQAWENCKDWITEFDGSPTLTLLTNIPSRTFLEALPTIPAGAENLRVTSIPAAKADAPEFIPFEAVPEHLAKLHARQLSELSLNYALRTPDFELDIHLVIFPMGPSKAEPEAGGQVALQLVWWNDQVFSEETNNPAQFAALMQYFIDLQQRFKASNLFVSPENAGDSLENLESWEEV